MSEELPILDLSGFHAYQPSDEVYRILQTESDEEDAALQELLGVQELTDDSFGDLPLHGNTPQLYWRLHNIAETPQHDIVALGLQLFAIGEEGEVEWTVYLFERDDYAQFWESVTTQIRARNEQNFLQWLYENYPPPESRYVEVTTNVDMGNGLIEKTTWADDYENSMHELAFELAMNNSDDHYLPESLKEFPEPKCTLFIRPAKRRKKKQMWLRTPPQ
jgi:hypothetical protein